MSRECALRSLERWRRAHEPPPEGVRLAQRLEDGKPFAYPATPAPSSSATTSGTSAAMHVNGGSNSTHQWPDGHMLPRRLL